MTGTKISNGNAAKLIGIMNVSLPPGKTCKLEGGEYPPCYTCGKCYALKSYRAWPRVRAAWDHNWALYQRDPDMYFASIAKAVAKKEPDRFRWGVGGCIPDEMYLDGMRVIARRFPSTRFLAYTKKYWFNYHQLPENLSVVFSMWPGWEPRLTSSALLLPKAWMQDGTEKRMGGDLCENPPVTCEWTCDACDLCWRLAEEGCDIIFRKH